jgi:regulator of Ty1 transposition protein 103
LTIGGTAEKIVSAFHSVISDHTSEDEEMNKCKSSVHRVRKLEKDVDLALTTAKDPRRTTLSKELEEEEDILKASIKKLKVVESNRLALVTQLRQALQDEESELEDVRTQMQVAQAQKVEASNMRKKLKDENFVSPNSKSSPTLAPVKDKKQKKSAASIAAQVADRLAASTSSQYIMSSVLSTFAAEEAKSAGHSNSAACPTPVYQQSSQTQYIQQQTPPGSVVVSYAPGYSTISQIPPPVSQSSYMVPLQMVHQHPMPSLLPPPPRSFRALQPPGMIYYNLPQ